MSTATSVRDRLRCAATAAMKQRDREATAAYRVALAAIDNAEAVPLVEQSSSSAPPPASSEVARRELTEREMVEIVRGEIEDRLATAADAESARPELATELRRTAGLLAALS